MCPYIPSAIPLVTLLLLLVPHTLYAQEVQTASPSKGFEALLNEYPELTYNELLKKLPPRKYLDKLSFKPEQAAHFKQISKILQLTPQELNIYQKNGFVLIDHDQRYSFGSTYWAIYARDLPVLITADSVLHALHKSYSEILQAVEYQDLSTRLCIALNKTHHELAKTASKKSNDKIRKYLRDVDLYLTVARNLLQPRSSTSNNDRKNEKTLQPCSRLYHHRYRDEFKGMLNIKSKLGVDKQAEEVLKHIHRPPGPRFKTKIYGGTRFIDYTQFKPRGHYTNDPILQSYFRAMQWLGRADCGWNIKPPAIGVDHDVERELKNSLVLLGLLKRSGALKTIRSTNQIIMFMVGPADDLDALRLDAILKQHKIKSTFGVARGERFGKVRKLLEVEAESLSRINSQRVETPDNPQKKTPPPKVFQLFAQRYTIDSFILSKTVFDSITYKGEMVERLMPSGLDLMAALGNNEAVSLSEIELRKYNYGQNILALQDFVESHSDDYWNSSLSTVWLSAIRSLGIVDLSRSGLPEVMQTRAWSHKMLQTQLASWAELRHDNLLYQKQSYSFTPACEYPAGYVEPYPEFYRVIHVFAERAKGFFDTQQAVDERSKSLQLRIKRFFSRMSEIMLALETMAEKELRHQQFSEKEKKFLKKTIDKRGGGSGPPTYSGWYPELFFNGGGSADKWDPVVADVHTDPKTNTVLEAGVGNANFAVVAINSESQIMAFVGPVYSYYEFRHPASNRLNDQQWQRLLLSDTPPARPRWVEDLTGPRKRRSLDFWTR